MERAVIEGTFFIAAVLGIVYTFSQLLDKWIKQERKKRRHG